MENWSDAEPTHPSICNFPIFSPQSRCSRRCAIIHHTFGLAESFGNNDNLSIETDGEIVNYIYYKNKQIFWLHIKIEYPVWCQPQRILLKLINLMRAINYYLN